MGIAKRITELRKEAGENRKEFSQHTGIPVRTLEDWEAHPAEIYSASDRLSVEIREVCEETKLG